MLPGQSPGGTALCPGLWVAAGLWGTCMPSAGVKVPTLRDFLHLVLGARSLHLSA